jgi:hypothetical protein
VEKREREKERREKLICYFTKKNCCWMSVVSYLKIQLKDKHKVQLWIEKCQSSLLMAGGDFKIIKIKAKPIRGKKHGKSFLLYL